MKRKPYFSRIADICGSAKAEIIALMKEKGVREVNLTRGSVYVISEDESGQLKQYPVTKVALANYTGTDVLEWDYDGPGPWYINPLVWVDLHVAVFRLLAPREYERRFLLI